MGKYKCEVVKARGGKNTEYMVIMDQTKCAYPYALRGSTELCGKRDQCICCKYTSRKNLYVCKFCDEEVLVNGGKEIGPATMYCIFGE